MQKLITFINPPKCKLMASISLKGWIKMLAIIVSTSQIIGVKHHACIWILQTSVLSFSKLNIYSKYLGIFDMIESCRIIKKKKKKEEQNPDNNVEK